MLEPAAPNPPAPLDMHESSTSDSDDSVAASLRGFGVAGIVAMIVIVFSGTAIVGHIALPVGATLALLWARLSRTPWREIGYVRPRSWIASLAIGLSFGVLLKLALKSTVMPLLGAPEINQAFHYLAGNRGMLPAAIWGMLVAGFGEETIFRGYMFERFGKLLGTSVLARASIVLVTSALFGAAHYALQGSAGAEQAAIVGLLFGTVFAVTGRIFMLMCAHAAFDLTALAIIYWNIESEVAHLFFK